MSRSGVQEGLKENGAVLLSIHGSIQEMKDKVGGDIDRFSEFVTIKKYAERFDEVFVFSDDRVDCSALLPGNCRHIRLYHPLLYLAVGWLAVLYHVRRHNIRAVHLAGSPALPLAFLVNRLSNAKVVLHYNYLWHTSYLHDTGAGLGMRLRKNNLIARMVKGVEAFLVNRFVDCIMLGTEEAREVIRDSKKIMPIKKGIILRNFDPKKVKAHEIYKKIRSRAIVFTGRLVPMKDPLTLVRAYNIVKERIEDVSLIVCGDGELMESCRNMAGRDAYFLGYVKEVPQILKGAYMYVQPSAYDPSPRSLLEAMAMGKPCIATRVGGVEGYLKGCGILVEPGDAEALAEKMIYLLENPELAAKLGEKAREKMLAEHDLEKNIVRELEILLK